MKQFRSFTTKSAKRQLALAVLATVMLGSTPVLANSYTGVTPQSNGKNIVANNRVTISGDQAAISNTDTSLVMDQVQKDSGSDWANVYGGYATESGHSVENNTLTISNAQLYEEVAGGLASGTAGSSDVVSNTLSIQDSTLGSVDDAVYSVAGGQGQGNIKGNQLILSGNTNIYMYPMRGYVTAGGTHYDSEGTTGTAVVSDNQLQIRGGNIGLTQKNAGGYSESGAVENNGLIISGDANVHSAYGEDVSVYQKPAIYGGYAETGTLKGNRLILSTSGKVDVSGITGAVTYGNGAANGNTVEISGTGTVTAMDIIGAYVQNGDVSDNKVIISNGSVSTQDVTGGSSGLGNATGNAVTLSGGAVKTDSIIGGIMLGKNGSPDIDYDKFQVSGNTITLSGGTLAPLSEDTSAVSIVGGLSGAGVVENNAINLNASMDLSTVNFYGWSKDYSLAGMGETCSLIYPSPTPATP